MKILILCDMFPPAFAPRMGYLCKYMKRAGWEISVVTEYIPDTTFSFLTGNSEVISIDYYKHRNDAWRHIEWLLIMILDFFFHYKDNKIEKAATRLLKEKKFDAILCCTYRTYPLRAARRLAAKYHLPLHVDLRDIIEQYASDEYIAHRISVFPRLREMIVKAFRKKLLKERNKTLVKANAISTVSPWHVKIISQYNRHVELIYNGFDSELFYPEKKETSQFTIIYTGRLINLATRDPKLLFEAIALLDKKKKIDPAWFRVQWYTDNASEAIIRPLAETYEIAPYMDFFGYISAEKIPALLNQSSVLLQLTNRSDSNGPKGFMTTKLFESLAVEKPLLCVRSDESYLEETIHRAHAGIAARKMEDVYQFLTIQLTEWKEKGYTSQQVNRDVVDSFSRQRQAQQFMKILTLLKNG